MAFNVKEKLLHKINFFDIFKGLKYPLKIQKTFNFNEYWYLRKIDSQSFINLYLYSTPKMGFKHGTDSY